MHADSFAEYITQIRTQRGFTLRNMAGRLGISPSYYNDVEKGRRNPLNLQKLTLFAQIACLTEAETNRLFDLAGEASGRVAPDIADYIKARAYVGAALRAARDLQADRDDWEGFIRTISEGKQAREP